jgi:hypothetical protein
MLVDMMRGGIEVFMLLWCIDVLSTSKVRSDYVVTKSGYV